MMSIFFHGSFLFTDLPVFSHTEFGSQNTEPYYATPSDKVCNKKLNVELPTTWRKK